MSKQNETFFSNSIETLCVDFFSLAKQTQRQERSGNGRRRERKRVSCDDESNARSRRRRKSNDTGRPRFGRSDTRTQSRSLGSRSADANGDVDGRRRRSSENSRASQRERSSAEQSPVHSDEQLFQKRFGKQRRGEISRTVSDVHQRHTKGWIERTADVKRRTRFPSRISSLRSTSSLDTTPCGNAIATKN